MFIRDHHERLLNTDHLMWIKLQNPLINGKTAQNKWVVAGSNCDGKFLPYLTETLDKEEATIRLDMILKAMQNGDSYLQLP